MALEILVSAIIDGVALGFIFLLLSLGLSVIFGLMRIVNFAHGSMFMWGAYIGYEVSSRTGNLLAGILASASITGLMGFLIEYLLLKRLREPLTQAIITIGLMLLLDRVAWLRWGDITYIWLPPELEGTILLGPTIIYKYRLFVIAVGIALLIAVYIFFNRTRYGMIIRAGIDDREMIQAFGVNIERVFTGIFVVGSILAGVAGSILVPWQGVYPTLGINYLLYAFAIVVIGGIGSIGGTMVASLLAGLAQQLSAYYAPYLAEPSIFLLMLAVLMLRPSGLLRV
ncbi:MAG: branched-chain amino acid ABC transporter permease [Sulfolobales archaeon]